jgi:hypothetical protein
MGLFSVVINSSNILGSEFAGSLQTKELESLMDYYWLSPTGQLFRIDYGDSYELEFERDESGFLAPNKKSTGKNGRIRPYRMHGLVRFTTTQDEALEAVTWFSSGILQQVLCRGPIFSCQFVDTGARHW